MTIGDRVQARRSPLQLTLLVALSVFAAVSPALFFLVFRPLAARIEAQERDHEEARIRPVPCFVRTTS